MADIDASLVQQIFDISQRMRKPDVQHHSKADDLGLVLKNLNEVGLFIPQRYALPLPRSSKVNLT